MEVDRRQQVVTAIAHFVFADRDKLLCAFLHGLFPAFVRGNGRCRLLFQLAEGFKEITALLLNDVDACVELVNRFAEKCSLFFDSSGKNKDILLAAWDNENFIDGLQEYLSNRGIQP